ALSVDGLPSNVGSASVSPSTVTAAGNAQLVIITSASASAGSYPLTITGSSGSLSHTATATLVVTPPPDFSLSASPASRSAYPGGTAGFTVSIGAINGFAGTVALAVSGLPAGVGSATMAPPTITAAGSSALTVNIAAGAPA